MAQGAGYSYRTPQPQGFPQSSTYGQLTFKGHDIILINYVTTDNNNAPEPVSSYEVTRGINTLGGPDLDTGRVETSDGIQ